MTQASDPISAVQIVPCKRHASKVGERCNVRVGCCAYRKALARPCPKCNAAIGKPCVNMSSRRDLWQGWEPEPHKERKVS